MLKNPRFILLHNEALKIDSVHALVLYYENHQIYRSLITAHLVY